MKIPQRKLTKKDVVDLMLKWGVDDREHTELSASWSKIWLYCTAAVALTKQFPEVEDTEDYTLEGTQAHFLAELLLLGKITKDQLPTEFFDLEFYYDKVMEIKADGNLWVEVKVDMTNTLKSHTPILGRSDFVVLARDGGIDIGDLKFGKGVKVSAIKNDQELLYAVGTLAFLDDLGIIDIKTTNPTTRVTLHIIQPRLDTNYSYYNTTVGELKEFVNFVRAQLKNIREGKTEYAKGERCQFCKGKSLCPMFQQAIVPVVEEVKTDLATLTTEQLMALYQKKADVMSFYRALEKYIKANIQLSENGEFMGYKIVEKEGNREVIDEEALIKQFTKAGCPKEDLHDTAIIGMTRLDKLAKQYGIAKDEIQGVGKKLKEEVVPVKDTRDCIFAGDGE